MSKLNSATIKQAICNYILLNPGCVKRLFPSEERDSIDEFELTNPKVWKRYHKESTLKKEGGDSKIFRRDTVERGFNASGSENEAIAEQVTAQVTTDATDCIILSLTIEG